MTRAGALPSAHGFIGFRGHRRQARVPRVPHRRPCQVAPRDAENGTSAIRGETVNLSLFGMAVRVARPLAVATEVQVSYTGAAGDAATMAGRIVHARRVHSGAFELGIELIPSA